MEYGANVCVVIRQKEPARAVDSINQPFERYHNGNATNLLTINMNYMYRTMFCTYFQSVLFYRVNTNEASNRAIAQHL